MDRKKHGNAKENCEKARHNMSCNSIIVTSLLSKFYMCFLELLDICKIEKKNEFCFKYIFPTISYNI